METQPQKTDLDHEKISDDSTSQSLQNNTTLEKEDQQQTQQQPESEVDPITASMIEITKSQILTSDQEQASSEEFITSNSHELIDSIYEAKKDQKEEEEETETELEQEKVELSVLEEQQQDLFEDVKMTYDLQNRITELSNSLITSIDLRTEEKEEETDTHMADSCVDLGKEESESKEEEKNPVVEEIIEEKRIVLEAVQLTESCVDLGNEESESREEEAEAVQNAQLTDSCVDIMGDKGENESVEEEGNLEEIQKLADDYQPNASMEIIDKKQCENEEDYENVEAEAVASAEFPKRNIEDEIWEMPLGGESLQKKITQYGEEILGRDYRPSRSQMCTISYTAFLKDTSLVVEQSDELSFILGDGDVISAIDLVVSLMSKNEKCDVITHARHAYGSLGKKPDIPGDATLCYKIHLKDFKDVTEYEVMEPVERLSLAEAKKLRGNFHFNRQDFNLAEMSYRKGLKYFDLQNLRPDDEKADLEKFAELKKALLMNLALSDFKQNEYKKALMSLNEVLDIESTHMKALYIRGKVLMHVGETQEAIQSLTKAHELAKDNIEVKNELIKAQAKHKAQYEKEKKMYQKMMRGTSEEKEVKKAKIDATKSSGISSFATYTAAGLLMAGATLGVAMFAKYKNLL